MAGLIERLPFPLLVVATGLLPALLTYVAVRRLWPAVAGCVAGLLAMPTLWLAWPASGNGRYDIGGLTLAASISLTAIVVGGAAAVLRTERRRGLVALQVVVGAALSGLLGWTLVVPAGQRLLAQWAVQDRWREEEARLRQCADTLTASLGAREAAQSIQAYDYRLRMLIVGGQEAVTEIVPGMPPQSGRIGAASSFATGPVEGRAGVWRAQVMVSPKGEIWVDPWGRLTRVAGDPPSAAACEQASMAYVGAYNRAILALPAAQTARAITSLSAD